MKYFKQLFTFSICLIATTISFSQVVPGNLVPNYSFDDISGKVKAPGSIAAATGWDSPTEPKADLFYKYGKNGFSTEEDNIYGGEAPWDGKAYAGIRTYSYKGAKQFTWLQAELTEELEEGRVYCGKFMLSCADLGKWANNNVGMHIGIDRPDGRDVQGYTMEPQIIHSRNKLIEMQAAWITVCRLYKAEGGEKWVTIGNFKANDDTEAKKLKRPKGFSKPQVNDGYYYIESVSLAPLDSLDDDCICETGGAKMQTVYTKNISDSLNMKWIDMEGVVKEKHAFFGALSAEILESSHEQLADIVKIMKEKPDAKLKITGHTDVTEQVKLDGTGGDDIAAMRAKAVFDYLVSKGVSSARMSHEGRKAEEPLDEGGTMDAIAKNRRTDFLVEK